MNIQDPIADMFTQIRNAQVVFKEAVVVPFSKSKWSVALVLKNEGYVLDCEKVSDAACPEQSSIRIVLKYHQGQPVISTLTRVSRPGLRIYKRKDQLPVVKSGLGTVLVSTSQGVMSDRDARRQGHGGEIIGTVS